MHILQPKHLKLNEKDAAKHLQTYNITKSQLPRIKHTDPVLADLNVKKGDIIKILRKSAEKEIEYFRVVV